LLTGIAASAANNTSSCSPLLSTNLSLKPATGTRTILLGKMKCELCHLMDEKDARPDTIASNLSEAAQFILKEGDKHGNLH